jgi:hypothetical protein
MYRDVTCWNTGNTYRVTDTVNLPVGMRFYTKESDGYYVPEYEWDSQKCYYKINKTAAKPSIYKRDWYRCKADEYKYAFTERTSRVITTDKDVYYNANKDRFISRTKASTSKEVVYGLPTLIVW